MNEITDEITIGTIGELLVQLRLLQYGVQAAKPLTDTGNDLIAVKGPVLKAIQIKTTKGIRFDRRNLPSHYHLVAFVSLCMNGPEVNFDETQVFLIPRESVKQTRRFTRTCLSKWRICPELVEDLFEA